MYLSLVLLAPMWRIYFLSPKSAKHGWTFPQWSFLVKVIFPVINDLTIEIVTYMGLYFTPHLQDVPCILNATAVQWRQCTTLYTVYSHPICITTPTALIYLERIATFSQLRLKENTTSLGLMSFVENIKFLGSKDFTTCIDVHCMYIFIKLEYMFVICIY